MKAAAALREEIEPGVVRSQWWHRLEDGRIKCDLCPRFCKLHEGQKAFCFVPEVRNGEIVLTSYGRASGYCVDPIEKKPLNHFYPGSAPPGTRTLSDVQGGHRGNFLTLVLALSLTPPSTRSREV
jgi:hypothetical protein